MSVRIIITGTPGTGKTKIAKALAKLTGWELVGLKEFINKHHLFSIKAKEKEVDIKKLARVLIPYLRQFNNYILEGHLACEIKLPADYVFVLRTDPKVLRKRLAKRKYSKEKLEENLMAEMLDYCSQRVEAVYKRAPLELDTTKRSPDHCAKIMLSAIKQRKKKLDVVNYTKELKTYLRLRK